jgi:hypothetical protein
MATYCASTASADAVHATSHLWDQQRTDHADEKVTMVIVVLSELCLLLLMIFILPR